MTRAHKPVVIRELAASDIQLALDSYLQESTASALAFVDAMENAFERIQDFPAAGSPKYAQELNLPDLRCFVCPRFPYLIFYMERADAIDVWRVLHARRDIPAYLEFP